jgi:hypothetical protein
MKILGLLVVIGLNISSLFSSTLESEVDQFRKHADTLLQPTGSHYEFGVIWDTMSPHLIGNQEYFEYALHLMFSQLPEQLANEKLRFPNPPHSPDVVTGGWQCLLGKLLKAKSTNDSDAQKDALLSLLALHIEVFRGLLPFLENPIARELMQDIGKTFPCARCVASARTDYISE